MHSDHLSSAYARRLGVVLLLAVLTLAGCGGGGSGTSSQPGKGISLTIGSKNDPDGQLQAEMYSLLLANQGFSVTTHLALGQTPVLDAAIKSGAVDMYPEFTGTALSLLNLPNTTDPHQAYAAVKAAYEQQFHVTWLDPAYNLNDSYGICTSQANATKYNLHSLADLPAAASQLTIAEQQDAKTILAPVEAAYGITFKGTTQITEPLSFPAVTQGSAQVNECYTTDPNIVTQNFVLLTDSKNAFPVYNPAPIVRDATLAKSSAIASTLNALEPKLTTANTLALIKQIAIDHTSVEQVAKTFLKQQGLLP
ncbi:MAG TPA: glycine betaine ABC transporter substrate-binding protein [Ktedonobacterales bacterium]|nr:glycine betaine ABC transporter substrate-binding protein [Ktedonobacterales bacterium]